MTTSWTFKPRVHCEYTCTWIVNRINDCCDCTTLYMPRTTDQIHCQCLWTYVYIYKCDCVGEQLIKNNHWNDESSMRVDFVPKCLIRVRNVISYCGSIRYFPFWCLLQCHYYVGHTSYIIHHTSIEYDMKLYRQWNIFETANWRPFENIQIENQVLVV